MSLNATDREIVEDLFAIIREWKPVVQAHQRDEVDDRVIFTDMAGVKHNATVDWLRDNWLNERDAEEESQAPLDLKKGDKVRLGNNTNALIMAVASPDDVARKAFCEWPWEDSDGKSCIRGHYFTYDELVVVERGPDRLTDAVKTLAAAEERIRKLETSAPDCAALLKRLKAAETNIAALKQQLNLSIQYRQGFYDRAEAELSAGRLSPNQYRVVIDNMPPIKDGELVDGKPFVDTDAILRDKAASWDLHNEGLRMAKLPPLPTVRERKALGGTLKMANGQTLTFADWQFVPAPKKPKAPEFEVGDKVRCKPGAKSLPYLNDDTILEIGSIVSPDTIFCRWDNGKSAAYFNPNALVKVEPIPPFKVGDMVKLKTDGPGREAMRINGLSVGYQVATCEWGEGSFHKPFPFEDLVKVAEEKTTAPPVACCAAGKPFLTGQRVVHAAYPNEFKGAGEIVELGGGSVCVKWNVWNGETRKVWHMPSKLKRA